MKLRGTEIFGQYAILLIQCYCTFVPQELEDNGLFVLKHCWN